MFLVLRGILECRTFSAKTGMCVGAKSIQWCPTLWNPVDCSPSGSSIHGILQARILGWVAISSSRRSSPSRNRTHVSSVSCIGRQVLYQQCQPGSLKTGIAPDKLPINGHGLCIGGWFNYGWSVWKINPVRNSHGLNPVMSWWKFWINPKMANTFSLTPNLFCTQRFGFP